MQNPEPKPRIILPHPFEESKRQFHYQNKVPQAQAGIFAFSTFLWFTLRFIGVGVAGPSLGVAALVLLAAKSIAAFLSPIRLDALRGYWLRSRSRLLLQSSNVPDRLGISGHSIRFIGTPRQRDSTAAAFVAFRVPA